jgi:hypothetical protein
MADIHAIKPEDLIAVDEITGSEVYNMAGEKLGVIEDIMIDRTSGRAIYAVMAFGGFLAAGDKHRPLPWSVLSYDPVKSGYVVNLDRTKLEKAPGWHLAKDFQWTSEYGRQIDHYYETPSFWA